jgi:hypothetical protein
MTRYPFIMQGNSDHGRQLACHLTSPILDVDYMRSLWDLSNGTYPAARINKSYATIAIMIYLETSYYVTSYVDLFAIIKYILTIWNHSVCNNVLPTPFHNYAYPLINNVCHKHIGSIFQNLFILF